MTGSTTGAGVTGIGWAVAGSNVLANAANTAFFQDDVGIIGMRATNDSPHVLRIYGTFTDATDFERVNIVTQDGGAYNITTEAGSAGGTRQDITFNGTTAIVNPLEGTAKITRKAVRQIVALTSGSTVSTTLSIPSGVRLLAVALNVDTAITNAGDDTWGAAFVTGSTTTVASVGTSPDQNTKINILLADEFTTDTTEILFTPQGADFTAGAVELVVWYEEITALANA
jgi:hypothetical protein